MASEERTIRPDAKGRITLGELAKGVSSYRVRQNDDGSVLLMPFAEIPAREAWLFKNEGALQSVKRGLQQSARGETKSLGSFAKFAESDDE